MTQSIPPHLFTFQDGVLRPRWPSAVSRHYKEGERYLLVPHEERSMRSHRHFFCAVKEGFENLPEEVAENFRSPDHLRQHALIRTGFCETQTIVMDSPEDARKMAAVLRGLQEYSIVKVDGCVVNRFTPKSQSYRTMNKEEFARSKTAVLDYIAGLVGVSKDDLEKNAGAAA